MALDRRTVLRRILPAGGLLVVVALAVVLVLRGGDDGSGSRAGSTTTANDSLARPLISRPDLRPPKVAIRQPARAGSTAASGLIFIAPKRVFGALLEPGQQTGAEIVDPRGRVRYFKPNRGRDVANDLRVQTYKGKQVLTYWYGREVNGTGRGRGVILDRHYRRIATVQAAGGLDTDFHEFLITPQDTALVTSYNKTRAPTGEQVVEGVVQELDIKTGKVLTEWHSLPDVKVSETYQPRGKRQGTFDYLHINGADIDADGNILVSARHTWAIYKIERHTGKLLWKLGGKDSDFQMGPGAQTAWQHAVRSIGPNVIDVFDNGKGDSGTKTLHKKSREVRIKLALSPRKTATLVNAQEHPKGVSAGTQGNGERLPGGGLFIGWGSKGIFSQFSRSGRMVFDARVPQGNDSYRAYKSGWTAAPTQAPSVAANARGSRVVVSASWNGSTQVQAWRALTGTDKDDLSPAGRTSWKDLETSLSVPRRGARYAAVQALDADGRVLARSRVTAIGG